MPDGSQRAGGRPGQWPKISGNLVDLITVAHPHIGIGWHSSEERVSLQHLAGSAAVLAGLCPTDVPAQGVAGQLHAVADAEHWDPESEYPWIAPRGCRFVDARRAAREDDALRREGPDAFRGDVVADDLTVDMLLADAAGDQLGVLRTKVEHQHPFCLLGGAG